MNTITPIAAAMQTRRFESVRDDGPLLSWPQRMELMQANDQALRAELARQDRLIIALDRRNDRLLRRLRRRSVLRALLRALHHAIG